MLKNIFIDVSPFIFNIDELNESTWITLEENKSFQKFKEKNPLVISILNKRVDLFKDSASYLDKIDNTVYLKILDFWKETFKINTKILLDKKILDNNDENLKNIINFIDVANENDVEITFLTHNPSLKNLPKILKLPKNTSIIIQEVKTILSIDQLNDYANEKDISLNEMLVITDDQNIIRNLIEAQIFCVTLDEKWGVNKNILIIKKIEDLNFGILSFEFNNLETKELEL